MATPIAAHCALTKIHMKEGDPCFQYMYNNKEKGPYLNAYCALVHAQESDSKREKEKEKEAGPNKKRKPSPVSAILLALGQKVKEEDITAEKLQVSAFIKSSVLEQVRLMDRLASVKGNDYFLRTNNVVKEKEEKEKKEPPPPVYQKIFINEKGALQAKKEVEIQTRINKAGSCFKLFPVTKNKTLYLFEDNEKSAANDHFAELMQGVHNQKELPVFHGNGVLIANFELVPQELFQGKDVVTISVSDVKNSRANHNVKKRKTDVNEQQFKETVEQVIESEGKK